MRSWIRWWGLGAFFAILMLVALLVWLFLDVIVERSLERTGTTLVGARVDLEAAHVSFAPVGIELLGLEVTNPEQPMRNAVEVDRIEGAVDPLQLLRRKVIIDELAVEGMRFDGERESSGAVRRSETIAGMAERGAGRALDALGLPAFEIPDPEQILAEADLESLRLAETVEAEVAEAQKRWRAKLAALPDQEKLETYQARAKQLGKGNVLSRVAKGASLANDVRADLKALEDAAKGLQEEADRLQARAKEVASAPKRDLERLREQYGFSGKGLSEIGRRLVGDQVAEWVARGLAWYERFQPMVSRAIAAKVDDGPEVVERVRGQGALVRFREREPLPDLLVRRAGVSIELDAGVIAGEVLNLTPDQPVFGKPMEASFFSDTLPGLESLRLEGVFDHVRPETPNDRLKARIRGFKLEDVRISDNAALPLVIERGAVHFNGEAGLVAGELRADLGFELEDGRFAGGATDNVIGSAIVKAFQDVERLSLRAAVRGAADDFDVDIVSDIDSLIQKAVGGLVESQLAVVQQQLLARIDGQLSGPLSSIQQGLGGLDGFEQDLASRIQIGNQSLGALAGSGGGKGAQTGGKQGKKGFSLPGGLPLP